MKSITTLVDDIYNLVGDRNVQEAWFNADTSAQLSQDIARRLSGHFNHSGFKPSLRLSQMGPRCPRALWYSIHQPELAEALPPWAKIKYAYGHTLEALGIALTRLAGHSVTGEQDELIVDGVVGHRDAVVDGCVVDFKSCSTRQFQKYKSKTLALDDSFGYLDQLDGYVVGSLQDDLVTCKDRGYIFAIDKTLGHCCLYEHIIRERNIRDRIQRYKEIVDRDNPPPCECGTRPDGESGNIILDTRASYSSYKHACFPNLRTFIYSDGPSFFVKVVKPPRNKFGPLKEVDKHGNFLYH